MDARMRNIVLVIAAALIAVFIYTQMASNGGEKAAAPEPAPATAPQPAPPATP